jgi:hypothetical protein
VIACHPAVFDRGDKKKISCKAAKVRQEFGMAAKRRKKHKKGTKNARELTRSEPLPQLGVGVAIRLHLAHTILLPNNSR